MKFFKNSYISFKSSIISELGNIPCDFNGNLFVPQGVCVIDDYILVTLYDYKKNYDSVVYIFKDSKYIKKVYIDGKVHAGGITYHKSSKSLYITGKGLKNVSYIDKYDARTLLFASNDDIITKIKSFIVDDCNDLYSSVAKHSSPAYVTCDDNDLYIGNFCSKSDVDKCVIKKFKINKSGDINEKCVVINNPFSYTQSFCIVNYDNKKYFVFSRSYGTRRNSLINICEFIDNNFVVKSTVVLPAMLEQICNYNNNIVAIFESCCDVYNYRCITVNNEIFYLDFDKLLKYCDTYRNFCKGSALFAKNRLFKF